MYRCCLKHVSCENVCTDADEVHEDGQQTVMVRETRDVCMGEEFLAHFGEQFPQCCRRDVRGRMVTKTEFRVWGRSETFWQVS